MILTIVWMRKSLTDQVCELQFHAIWVRINPMVRLTKMQETVIYMFPDFILDQDQIP
jgi:hypothetical protein